MSPISIPGKVTLVKDTVTYNFATIQSYGIVTDGLVLLLDAGAFASYPGTGTTWTDLSDNGNDGTLVNGVGYDSGNQGSLTFDGANDYVILSNFDKAAYSTTNFSLSLWFNADSGSYKSLFQAADTLNSNLPWIALIGYVAGFRVYVNANYRIDVPYTQGAWNNFALTFDSAGSGLWTAYLNGSSVGSYTGPIGSLSASGTYLGQAYNNSYFDGKISNFAVHQKTLSSTEVTQNFNALKGRFGL